MTIARRASQGNLALFPTLGNHANLSGTSWWSKGDSNRDALGDAFVNLRAFPIENQQFWLEFPPPAGWPDS
jgi:hypothetical protein